jgi:glutathione S-transferase
MVKECAMKLLGSTGSPYVARVKFALKLKSVDYEYIQEDLANKSELLLKSNPLQKVPVFFHENEPPLSESLVIIEYLDEILPDVHPLLPSNASDRAQSRFIAYYIDTMYAPWIKEFMLTRDDIERREELKKLLIEGSVMLEQAFVMLSKGKPFFGGDDIGYLDIVVGCFLGWIKFHGMIFGFNAIDEARNPKLTQWGKTMWSHEATRSVIPSDEVHMKFFKMLLGFLPPLPTAETA